MTTAHIELHIEELVLHGFQAGDHHRIGEALERELTRLLDEHGIPSLLHQSGEVAYLDGGAFHIAPGSRAEVIGTQVAQTIYRRYQQG